MAERQDEIRAAVNTLMEAAEAFGACRHMAELRAEIAARDSLLALVVGVDPMEIDDFRAVIQAPAKEIE